MSDFDDLPEQAPQTGPEEPEPKSRSQIKREAEALQVLGAKLVELRDAQLDQLPLDERLRKALIETRTMRHREGRRRQLQFIGKLMRAADHEAIAEGYERLTHSDHHSVQQLHLVERWRDRIIGEGDKAMGEFVTQYPEADRQHLRALLRGAQKERSQEKPPAQARKLYRYLRDLMLS